MNSQSTSRRLLVSLFEMSQSNEIIELIGLCQRADVNLYSGLSLLDRLGRAGLLDPRKLRLTLEGLAVCSSLKHDAVQGQAHFERVWLMAA